MLFDLPTQPSSFFDLPTQLEYEPIDIFITINKRVKCRSSVLIILITVDPIQAIQAHFSIFKLSTFFLFLLTLTSYDHSFCVKV